MQVKRETSVVENSNFLELEDRVDAGRVTDLGGDIGLGGSEQCRGEHHNESHGYSYSHCIFLRVEGG